MVKEGAYDAVQQFFSIGKMMKAWNCTAVTLIPEVQSPTTVKDFRPIACCSSIYKLVAKILTNRMKKVLNGLIGSSQFAFIEGRNI